MSIHEVVVFGLLGLALISLLCHLGLLLQPDRSEPLPRWFAFTASVSIGLAVSTGLVWPVIQGALPWWLGEPIFGPMLQLIYAVNERLPEAMTVHWDPVGHPLLWALWMLLNALYLGVLMWSTYVVLRAIGTAAFRGPST